MKYSFCPKCAGKLTKKLIDDKLRLVCKKCGFIFYQNSKPTASALIIKRNKVLLGKRAIEPFKNLWDVPGGFLEENESPKIGLSREVKEELGVKIKIGKMIGIFMDTYGQGGDWTLNIYYEAKIISGVPKAASDVAELRWFDKNKMPKMAFKNQLELMRVWLEK